MRRSCEEEDEDMHFMWNLPGQRDLKTKKEVEDTVKLDLREGPVGDDNRKYFGLYDI
jgi:hypothetical protein